MDRGRIAQQTYVAGAGDVDIERLLRRSLDVAAASDIDIETLDRSLAPCARMERVTQSSPS